MLHCLKIGLVAVLAIQNVAGFSVQQVVSPTRESALYMAPAQTNDSKEIKVGVIGCGRIGLVHLEAITKAPGVTPIVVSNPTISKAEAGKNSYSCFHFQDVFLIALVFSLVVSRLIILMYT